MAFKKTFSISLKLSAMVGFAMLFIAVAISIVTVGSINSYSRQEEINNIVIIAEGKAQEVGEWLGGTNSMLRAYAETEELKSDDWDIIQPVLSKAYNRINDTRYLFLAYVQQDGRGWTTKNAWLDANPLPYFPPIIKENQDFYITNPFIGATTNEPLIIIGHGVRQDGSTKNTGIMIAGIEGKSISSIAQNISIGGVGYGVIVDNGGVFVAHPDVDKVMKLNIRDLDNQGFSGMTAIGNDMINGVQNVRQFKENGEDKYMVYVPIPNSPNWTLGIIVPASYFTRLSNKIIGRVLPISIVVIIVMFILILLLIRRISKSLKKTAGALKDIAGGDGDLTVRLDESGSDEVAEISYYFNRTIEKIDQTLLVAAESSKSVESMSDSLANDVYAEEKAVGQIMELIDKLHKDIENQHSGISNAASSVDLMSSTISDLDRAIDSQNKNINTSSSAIEQMIANIESVTDILSKNQKLIDQMESKSQEVKESIQNSSVLTQEINSESENLLEASQIIQNIAEQTNLLAMNAAIEAAHAGESGKGFAVVADEIRKLAEESASQSKNITEVLEALKEKISLIAADSVKTENDFMQSFELTTAVKQQEEVIMSAMREQSEGGTQVIKAVSEIADSTVSVKNGSSKMIENSRVILGEMKNLTEISNQIDSSIQNIADGISGFEKSIGSVGDMANNTKHRVEDLNGEIGKFKM